ncbi:MAG: bifunctional non-ous end joining protein LigD [Thermoplasmata archaeon]|jgi:bifunctional non-homologous end joining protein LigD|nr:bifunctional non-ous end joining protein LigD [Thermoplasmata archaeon]
MPDDWVPPMLATPATLPERPLEFAFEYKWDGVRALASRDGGRMRVWSRNGNDVTHTFPELQPMARQLPARTVVDGEVVALDAHGRPSFPRMQRRLGLLDPGDVQRQVASNPVHYFAFDVLRLRGTDLTQLPYTERRAALESLALQGANWSTPPSHVGVGDAMLQVSRAMGLEGIVAKRLASPYLSGRRSPSWLKIRNRLRQEFVIGGWKEGQGARAGAIGNLLVGHHDRPGGTLRYVGKVGTGFGGADGARLLARLQAIPVLGCPFGARLEEEEPDVHWVDPRMVCEVEFSNLTPLGLLFQASFKGLRNDKPATEVVWEQAEVKPWRAQSGAEPSASAS